MFELETFWADLLSSDPERVWAAWESLDENEQVAVYLHLMQMLTEGDWSEPQRLSAQAALDTLQDHLDGE
jgi:hypothetical protein